MRAPNSREQHRLNTPDHRVRSIRRRSRRAVGAIAVGALIAGCSSGRDTDAADATPTFHQVRDDVLRYEEPISQVADLIPPAEPGGAWNIVGGVLDPETGRTEAAVWSTMTPAGWEKTDIDAADPDVSEMMAAAAPFNGSLLAVGKVGEGAQADAALWRADGSTWRRSAPAAMGGKHEQWAFDVAVGDGGVVIAGGESVWGEVRPLLWHSTDGNSWTAVDGGPGGPLDLTGEESVQAITAFNAGFVSVGMRDIDGDQDGTVWFSPDGVTWEKIDAPTMGGPGRQNVLSVATVNGTLVAGGYQVDGDGHGQPVVWTSVDGRNWSPPSPPLPVHTGRSAVSDLAVRSLSVDGGRLVAAGGNDWQPHIWTSDDTGATWQPLDDPVSDELFADGVDLVDAVSAFGAILALGDEPTVMELRRNRWTDATGENFPTGGNRPQATSVTVNDGDLLAAGFNYTAPRGDQRQRYTGRVWLKDGGGFDVVAPNEEQPALEAGQINDLARFKHGYVAVGFEDFSYANQRNIAIDGQPDGLLWTSEDGKRWNRQAAEIQRPDPNALTVIAQDPNAVAQSATELAALQPMISLDPLGGQGTRSLEAVASLGDGYIAVGSAYVDADGDLRTPDYDTNPVVIVSPDGTAIAGEDPILFGPGTQRLLDVCVAKDGSAIAVGTSGTDRNFDVAVRHRTPVAGAPGVWVGGTAADGSFEGPGSQEALACAVGDDGFLIVGADDSRGNTDARVWSSPDGVNWQEVPSGSLGGTGNQVAAAAAAVPGGGWLVGGTDTMSGDSDIALWRVKDRNIIRRDRGERSLAGPGDQVVESLAVTGNRAVIVGQDQTGVGIWETSRLDR